MGRGTVMIMLLQRAFLKLLKVSLFIKSQNIKPLKKLREVFLNILNVITTQKDLTHQLIIILPDNGFKNITKRQKNVLNFLWKKRLQFHISKQINLSKDYF